MFRRTLIAALLVLFSNFVFAGDVIMVSGKFADAYLGTIHMYQNGDFMQIEKVPNEAMEKIRKLDRDDAITLKIKKTGGKNVFVSLEEQQLNNQTN